jgi:hypothetical protein
MRQPRQTIQTEIGATPFQKFHIARMLRIMPTIRAEVAYFEKTVTGKLFHPAVKRLKYDHRK